MPSFVIYNPTTGAIQGSLSASHDDVLDLAANTPSGMSTLAVDPSHAVITDQSAWIVKEGVLTGVVPTDAELLATAKETQLGTLTASYNTAKTANVGYMNTSFMADSDSQQIFAHALTAYTALGSTPSDFYAVDSSYAKVPMTLAQLQGLIEAIATQVWAAFQRWVAVKQALAAATTVPEVQAISW